MLRQSTRERARILGGMGRADRRGLTMTGVIDVGVEGGLHGGITLGGALAELQAQALSLSLGWGAFDGGASTRCINHAVSRARALAELNRCVGACSMQHAAEAARRATRKHGKLAPLELRSSAAAAHRPRTRACSSQQRSDDHNQAAGQRVGQRPVAVDCRCATYF